MSDKELIFQAANTYIKNTVNSLFGIQSLATDTLITYVVKNAEEKWGKYLDLFVNSEGNIDINILEDKIAGFLPAIFTSNY